MQVSLSATDNSSGVLGTFYKIDGGATQTYAGPFVISALGQHTIEYWSVDNANNAEATHSLAIKTGVDQAGNSATATTTLTIN